MTLNALLLSEDIQDAVEAVFDIQDAAKLEDFSDAIATAIVDHLTTSAIPTGQVIIPGGSSSGSYPLTSGVLT